jgi:hypothetical protein
MRLGILIASALTAAALTTAVQSATKSKAIYTGGAKGAYNATFCPPLVPALGSAQFPGYKCTACVQGEPCGSVANIERCMAEPTAICFSQLDVYARTVAEKPEVGEKTTIVKQLACEGIWMVTKNPRMKNFGDVLGLARRLPFVIAEGGSTSTFEYMQSIDPDGLGRARNVDHAKDATAVINAVAGSSDSVGMFVQFADPENANIKLMAEKQLTVIPVVSRELVRAKAGGHDVYQVQEFSLVAGYFAGKTATTACTPIVIITGSPKVFTDKNDVDDQNDLIKVISQMSDEDLLPKEGRIASIIKKTKRISGKALDELNGAVEAAKKRMEQSQ